jgi:hypothetical protein
MPSGQLGMVGVSAPSKSCSPAERRRREKSMTWKIGV